MASALAVNPLANPFLGSKLSIRENLNRSRIQRLNCRSPKCSVDVPQGVLYYHNTTTTTTSNPIYPEKRGMGWSGLVFPYPNRLGGSNRYDLTIHGNIKTCSTFPGIPKFPRKNVWDPYKRLGISSDAASEEVWTSRNFLVQQYSGDESSVEAIEAAFEKLLMKSFIQRKKTKINLKTRLKQKVEESPSWVKNMLSFVELPEKVIVLRRLFLFTVLAGWSIMNSAEGGPAFQVAVALAACTYFLYDKSKSLGRASAFGFGSLVAGWICGSFLGPMVPTFILPATWTLELSTSLVAFVFMFLGCTYLK